jgi:hypothetical protein
VLHSIKINGFFLSLIRKTMIPCLKNIYFITNLPRFQKKGEKKKKKSTLWASRGHETACSGKFGAKLSLPYPFFS